MGGKLKWHYCKPDLVHRKWNEDGAAQGLVALGMHTHPAFASFCRSCSIGDPPQAFRLRSDQNLPYNALKEWVPKFLQLQCPQEVERALQAYKSGAAGLPNVVIPRSASRPSAAIPDRQMFFGRFPLGGGTATGPSPCGVPTAGFPAGGGAAKGRTPSGVPATVAPRFPDPELGPTRCDANAAQAKTNSQGGYVHPSMSSANWNDPLGVGPHASSAPAVPVSDMHKNLLTDMSTGELPTQHAAVLNKLCEPFSNEEPPRKKLRLFCRANAKTETVPDSSDDSASLGGGRSTPETKTTENLCQLGLCLQGCLALGQLAGLRAATRSLALLQR